MDEVLLTTGEAAHLANRSPQMIRLYERKGRLKASAKTVGGLRLFRASDVRKLAAELQSKTEKRSETISV